MWKAIIIAIVAIAVIGVAAYFLVSNYILIPGLNQGTAGTGGMGGGAAQVSAVVGDAAADAVGQSLDSAVSNITDSSIESNIANAMSS